MVRIRFIQLVKKSSVNFHHLCAFHFLSLFYSGGTKLWIFLMWYDFHMNLHFYVIRAFVRLPFILSFFPLFSLVYVFCSIFLVQLNVFSFIFLFCAFWNVFNSVIPLYGFLFHFLSAFQLSFLST